MLFPKSIFLLLIAFAFLAGCQLPLANYFRDQVFPQKTVSKVVLAPVLFPSYAVLSVVDIMIINPVRGCENVPNAASTIWNWPKDSPGTSAALIPLKVIAIPIAALGTAMFSEQFLYQDTPSETPSLQK